MYSSTCPYLPRRKFIYTHYSIAISEDSFILRNFASGDISLVYICNAFGKISLVLYRYNLIRIFSTDARQLAIISIEIDRASEK